MQRLRIKFCRGEEIKFISHLDLVRMWHRAFRRAGMPLAYSEGFKPHPRISLAAPLAVGVTGDAELMDVTLSREVSPQWFSASVNSVLPRGARILQAVPISLTQPSLQAQIGFAEYRVEVETILEQADIESAIDRLLSLESLPWQHQRDTGVRSYDLRGLIEDLWLEQCQPGCCIMGMLLRSDSGGSGRPEQVAVALGFAGHPRAIHRTRLVLKTG